MGGIRGRLTLTLSLAGALTLALGVAQAFAATNVTYSPSQFGSQLSIVDATNDADVVDVSLSGNTITITDTGTGGITTADPDCAVVNATTVTCPFDPPDPAPPAPPNAPVNNVFLQLRDGTDSFTNHNLDAGVNESDNGELGNKTVSSGPSHDNINTGTGNDSIDTGTGNDSVEGDPGEDAIATGPGSDFAEGEAGNDTLDMGDGNDFLEEDDFANGADTLNGGPGLEDGMDYCCGQNGVTMTLNGQADDGHPGEGDNIVGVEGLFGTDGPDLIGGDDSPNQIDGNDGNDLISGAGGDDEISQGEGDDAVDAGAGSDLVFAGSQADGADVLAGGDGAGDEVDYCCGLDPVTINQNGQADDGRAGEGDNLSGFEGFDGGNGADSITGTAASNLINGNEGADLLVGLGGGDEFFAGPGDDTLVSSGGAGAAAASSKAAGKAKALRARDHLQCDLGFDTIAADARDVIGGDCERRGAEVTSDSARVSAKGSLKLQVSCPAEEGARCVGKLALLSNGKQIGKGSYKVPKGKTRSATARLSKKGKRALAASDGTLFVSAEARTKEPPGVTANADRVLLTKAKPKRGGGGGRR